MTGPSPEIIERVVRLLGWAPDTWRPVHGGYTPTARYAVADGKRRGFVKIATTELTARMINREIANYAGISGRFVPRVHDAQHSIFLRMHEREISAIGRIDGSEFPTW